MPAWTRSAQASAAGHLQRALAGLSLIQALASCSAGSPPTFDHIVLISIDTLRADHLGSYGNERVETPRIDAFASEGVLFEQHVSVAPVTLPSHTSLMTGTYPRTHGTPRNGFIVDESNTLLAERLRDAGFTTAGFVSAVPLASSFGFAQGFDSYDEPVRRVLGNDRDPAITRRADWMTDRVLQWLDEGGAQAERLFVFVHYFDVHYPYENGEPWDSMYRDEDMPDAGGSMQDLHRLRRAFRRSDPEAAGLSRARAAAYAGGVTWTDGQIGRLLDGLAERGLLDRSLVILTSDHGETMDSHPEELWDHGLTLFEETMHVPLILRFPSGWQAGRRVSQLVANIDLAPTLLEWLSLPPLEEASGTSFAPLVAGGTLPPRAPVFLEAMEPSDKLADAGALRWRNERKRRAARSQQWKLLFQPWNGEVRAYDLLLDPGETVPLAPGAPEPRQLQLDLEEWAAGPVRPERREALDPETREQLRALGYGG